MAILQDTSAQGYSHNPELAQVMARLAALEAENAALRAKVQQAKAGRVTIKVSEKGAVQLLGIGSKFGITMYAETFLTVLGMATEIKAFIEAHKDQLSWR